MKTLKKLAAMAAIALTTVFGLASCNNDQEPEPQPKPGKDTFQSTAADCKIAFSEDYLKLYNVTLTVTDFEGKTQDITITNADVRTLHFETTNPKAKASVAVKSTDTNFKPNADDMFDFRLTNQCNVTVKHSDVTKNVNKGMDLDALNLGIEGATINEDRAGFDAVFANNTTFEIVVDGQNSSIEFVNK